jgi:hypothetical protein
MRPLPAGKPERVMLHFGPFSVDPRQVAALGGAYFGQFVGRLVATETSAHGMAGTTLETTYLENVGDGGVDAGLRDATGTSWLPAGDSAWQFKAGDLSPAKCKTELEGATRAIEILRAGGSYRLVLGASLTSDKIAARRAKLKEAARGLGMIGADPRIDVIAADGLARWIEEFPALAVNPLLRGTGVVGQTFEEWSRSIRHTTLWVSSPERDVQIAALRTALTGGTQLDLHLDGVSGLGKTRLVLEALRGQPYEAIVVYSAAADSFPVTVLTQLQSQKRRAVVVIDECDRKQHEIYAQVLTTGTTIRLLTIGEPGGSSTRTPMISLGAFGNSAMEKLLQSNRPSLSSEAGRVVVQVAAGNIDYALKLAQLAIEGGPGSAGRFVTEEDLRAFFTNQLPNGQLFLSSCALALFSRFGLDGETAHELEVIAGGLGVSADELRAAATELQRRGLLSKQGRYRSVGPHPVAIYLAAKGWEEFGHRIVADLLPAFGPDLTERLFRRAADVGELDAASPAMAAVLAKGGLLASLDSIAEGRNSGLLVHFAVLAPEAVADRLAELLAAASEDELQRGLGIRRDLVWTLEKLAWHSKTFATAADAILRLAIAENESYSNNASGTWIEFFGAMLPGTAATPDVRMAYLQASAASDDSRVRALAVQGAYRALDSSETIMVSGEVQGGVVVEGRGTPPTFGDVWTYRNSAIDVLASLTADLDQNIAEEASRRLVDSLQGLLEETTNREHLGQVIAKLSPEVISRARIQVEGLRSLFDRGETRDGLLAALTEFEGFLPQISPRDRLTVLANTGTWDRRIEEVADELVETARRADVDDPVNVLVGLVFSTADLPGAHAIGRALRLLRLDYSEGVAILSSLAGTANGEALIGFLRTLVDEGDVAAFDRYLDEADLPPFTALQYSVRGARTAAAAARVDQLMQQVTVGEAARVLFAWMHDADQVDSARYVRQWESRIATQADYNAAVDFAARQVFQKPDFLPDLDPAIADLVPRRRDYPEVGQESRDWSVLARRQLQTNPLGVVKLVADLVEADALTAFSRSEETSLLQDAVRLGGEEAWVELMDRLQRGEWRLSISAREWLGNAVTVDIAKNWVGESFERARTLANVTKPGGTQLAPVARYLIDEFGKDDQVPSHLVGQFTSGMWTGNESERIASQIANVQSWIAEPGQSTGVKSWSRKLIASLTARRQSVLLEEEERGW